MQVRTMVVVQFAKGNLHRRRLAITLWIAQ